MANVVCAMAGTGNEFHAHGNEVCAELAWGMGYAARMAYVTAMEECPNGWVSGGAEEKEFMAATDLNAINAFKKASTPFGEYVNHAQEVIADKMLREMANELKGIMGGMAGNDLGIRKPEPPGLLPPPENPERN
jgi:hypothetical protein